MERRTPSRVGHVSPPSMVDEVVKEMRSTILSGVLKPGERLVEERLTERFGVSRPPLREALLILQQEGLVQRVPRKGAVVTPLTAADVREIYTLRWALERLAIDLAIPVVDHAELEPLRETVEDMRAAVAAGDRDRLLAANMSFHLELCALPRHRRLLRVYESLMLQLRLCMAMNLRFRAEVSGDPGDSVRRHERLLALIESGDKAAIHAEIEVHGDRSFMDRLEDFIGTPGGERREADVWADRPRI